LVGGFIGDVTFGGMMRDLDGEREEDYICWWLVGAWVGCVCTVLKSSKQDQWIDDRPIIASGSEL